MIKATIITIGDEILIGQIVDTNSVSIAKHLNKAGITVAEKLSIGDNAEQIEATLKRAHQQSQVVIITGGLGPTKDDITKHTLARIFSSPLVENKAVAEHVEKMLAVRGIAFNALNR
jgi:nicotinamide-nucleotide amidase